MTISKRFLPVLLVSLLLFAQAFGGIAAASAPAASDAAAFIQDITATAAGAAASQAVPAAANAPAGSTLTALQGLAGSYTDPAYFTGIPFGSHSHWLQPWRAYLETVPAGQFLEGIGMVLNLNQENPELIVRMLAKNGIRTVRIEIGWSSVDYADETRLLPSQKAKLQAMLQACKTWNIRPLILLNAHQGIPGPMLSTTRTVAVSAAVGASELQLNNTSGLVAGKSGLSNLTGYWAAEALITSVDQQTVTLSKPLPQALAAGAQVTLATLKYLPFSVPDSPEYLETMQGWTRYMDTVARFVGSELGTEQGQDRGFDLEIWNELSFGSNYLYINKYYNPAPYTYDERSIWANLVRASADYAASHPDLFQGVSITDGFANTIPWPASSQEPDRIRAINKHPYSGRKTFPANETAGTKLNALGAPDAYVPAYTELFPEYFATAIQTETMVRDMGPFTAPVNRVLHGRYARASNPTPVWITEVGIAPNETGITDHTQAMKLKEKTTSRYYPFFLNKGVEKLYLYGAAGGDMWLGIMSDSFLEYSRTNSSYPQDDAAYTSPALSVIGRMASKMEEGLDPQLTATRPLQVDSITDTHGNYQFAGDGTVEHPALYNRELFTVLPYQVNDHKFVIPYYVMTRDVTRNLAPEEYTLQLSGIKGTAAAVTVYDPINNMEVPVQVNSSTGNTLNLRLQATDYPYLLTIEEAEEEEPVNLLADVLDPGFGDGAGLFTLQQANTGGSQAIVEMNGNPALELRDASLGSNLGSLFTARITSGSLLNRINRIYDRQVGDTPVEFVFRFKLARTGASSKAVPKDIKAGIQFGNYDNALIPRFPTGEQPLMETAAYRSGDGALLPVTEEDIPSFRFKIIPNGGQRHISNIELRFAVRVDTGGTDEAYAIDDLAVYELPGEAVIQNKLLVDGVELSDPTGLYVLQEGQQPPAVVAEIRNSYPHSAGGTVRLSVYSRGTEQVLEQTAPFSLAVNATQRVTVPLQALDQGDYYKVKVEVIDGSSGSVSGSKELAFGLLHPAAEGVREQSPFGLDLRVGNEELAQTIAERIGVKWKRAIDKVDPTIVNPEPGKYWTDAQIQAARQEVLDWQEHGVSSLGYINYNMAWNVMPVPGMPNLSRHQNRPLDLAAQAEMVYHTIAPLQDLVKNWEIWNEPWIHGWTWKTGEAQDYREMAKLIWERVKPEYPDVMLIGGGSAMYNRDILYAKGSPDTGYVDGSVNHAYGLPDPEKFAMISLQKIMDETESKGQGKGGMWQTELGTAEPYDFAHFPAEERPYGVARTIAPIYLLNMLAAGETPLHVFWFSLSADLTYSGDAFNLYDTASRAPKPGVIAYSAMTHFLEDSKLLEELYPVEKSTWGFLFQRQDGQATAALYAEEPYNGTVKLENAAGIKIYDYLGRLVSDGSAEQAVLQLKPWETFYLVSSLSPAELKERLRTARFDYTEPVSVSPLSLLKPVTAADAALEFEVENVTPETIDGRLAVQAPEGWQLAGTVMEVRQLQPGEKRRLIFPASETAVNEWNRYPVRYIFERLNAAGQTVSAFSGQQTVQVAYAPKKTIRMDEHTAEDWSSVLPVTMVSNGSVDYLELIMDPSKIGDILENPQQSDNVVYTVKTAWDEDNFYFRAVVPDEMQLSNKPFAEDPYAFPFNADSVQLAFDVLTNNPDDLLLGRSHYAKATSANMDYLFIGTMAQGEIPELHRQAAPGTNKQTYYPTNADLPAPLGPIDATASTGSEGRIKVSRDDAGKTTVYDIALSWNTVPELKNSLLGLEAGQVHESSFAFAIQDAGTGGKGTSYWTREAGQVESGSYAFAPFWGTGSKARGGSFIPRWGFMNESAGQAAPDSEGAPGKPVLSDDNGVDHGLQDGDYNISMNMWWGNNGSEYKLYENGQLIDSRQLTAHTPQAQFAQTHIRGRNNGVYRYYAELTNESGTTRSEEWSVNVTDAAPAQPVLSQDNWDGDGSYTVTMNMWWGTNGATYRLYENGVLVDTQTLAELTPQAQAAATTITGKPPGSYEYRAELENAAGVTVSEAVIVQVTQSSMSQE
ncbi:MAG: putative glycosyl hydrolase [Paenibacillaceae bacterium]|jgi:hypothetical protein|nr:putative glycosyl hydrolase [Paenibacillaceae bacterium]